MTDAGLIVIARLHRLVRHGWRPWLGYDVASGQDRDIHLRRKRSVVTISADATVTFDAPIELAFPRHGESRGLTIAGDDQDNFDALLPPNTRNKRNLMRRLYEIGL